MSVLDYFAYLRLSAVSFLSSTDSDNFADSVDSELQINNEDIFAPNFAFMIESIKTHILDSEFFDYFIHDISILSKYHKRNDLFIPKICRLLSSFTKEEYDINRFQEISDFKEFLNTIEHNINHDYEDKVKVAINNIHKWTGEMYLTRDPMTLNLQKVNRYDFMRNVIDSLHVKCNNQSYLHTSYTQRGFKDAKSYLNKINGLAYRNYMLLQVIIERYDITGIKTRIATLEENISKLLEASTVMPSLENGAFKCIELFDLLFEINCEYKFFENIIKSAIRYVDSFLTEKRVSSDSLFELFNHNVHILKHLHSTGIHVLTSKDANTIENDLNHLRTWFFFDEFKNVVPSKVENMLYQMSKAFNVKGISYENYVDKNNNLVPDVKDVYDTFINSIGESNEPLLKLVRNDQIEEFITYITLNNVSLDSRYKLDYTDTNANFIGYRVSLFEYSVFHGSMKIMKYLYLNKAKILSNVSITAFLAHSECPEMLHFFEDNKISIDVMGIFDKCLICGNYLFAKYLAEQYPTKITDIHIKLTGDIYFSKSLREMPVVSKDNGSK